MSNKTVTIQIGNSDDKLTQVEWHTFVEAADQTIARFELARYFFGAPPNHTPWQNATWVIMYDTDSEHLRSQLNTLRLKFKQDSIAWTEGDTEFI